MDRGSAAGRPKPPASWAGVSPRGSSRSASGIPACLGDDPLEHRLVQPRRQGGLQQRPCIPAAQRLDAKLREARQAAAHLTRPEGERDPLGKQAARHERERSGRCAIEPLRVVDHAEERLLLGSFREETENREPDEKRVRRAVRLLSPKATPERITLRIGKALDELEHRRTEPLQRRVVELHLPLDTSSPNDAKIPARLDRVLEQRGLADAGVSVHHEDGRPARYPAAARAPRARVACQPTAQPGPRDHPRQHATGVRDYGFPGFDRRRRRDPGMNNTTTLDPRVATVREFVARVFNGHQPDWSASS